MQDHVIEKKTKGKISSIEDFFDFFEPAEVSPPEKIFSLDFHVKKMKNKKKLPSFLDIAEPRDAEKIAGLFQEEYNGTYPYKNLSDVDSLQEIIEDENNKWLTIKVDNNKIIGCVALDLFPSQKKALHHGFLLKSSYRHKIDTYRAFLGSTLYYWKTYCDQINIWYGEIRTYSSVMQFGSLVVGLKPIGFFPNKDIFFNNVESDILVVTYNKNTISNQRDSLSPKIIREATKCFDYTRKRFPEIGFVPVSNPVLNVDRIRTSILKGKLKLELNEDHLKYIKIRISLNNETYLTCEYNRYSQCIEKTKYSIKTLEELSALLQEMKEIKNRIRARYIECYVPANNPEHQRLFYEYGFQPRGYVPCWEYNAKTSTFEDSILFNSFDGALSKNIELLPETRQLLRAINLLKNLREPKGTAVKAVKSQSLPTN